MTRHDTASGYSKRPRVWATGSILFVGAVGVLAWLLCGAAAFSAEPQRLAVTYTVSIKDAPSPELEELLASISDTFGLQDVHPPSVELLRIRMNRDLPQMVKALRSHGYFQGEVAPELDETATPVHVVFEVRPGPRFQVTQISVTLTDPNSPAGRLSLEQRIGSGAGRPYMAEDVVSTQDRLTGILRREGFPFPKIVDRQVVVDHAEKSVRIAYRVDPGPPAVFGETQITGAATVAPSYVRRQLPWSEGDSFDAAQLSRARIKLIETGLFSVVEVKPGDVDATGRLSILIGLKERSQRTVRAGLGYQTDTGMEVKLEWEHRNFLGAGERFTVALNGNEMERTFQAVFRKPNFFSEKQALILSSSLSDENTDAYRSTSWVNSAAIERQWTVTTSVGFGVRYRLTQVEDDDETYGLFSIPLFLKRETSDDLLDPSRGGRLTLQLAPFTDVHGKSGGFFKFLGGYRHYLPLMKDKRLILAFRGLLGIIDGGSRNTVPKDELFYAGGGGSVRGYRYQSAGNLQDGEPVGGLSTIEVAGEVRYRFTDKLGMVLFMDGGRAYDTDKPDPEQPLFWGTGLGFRYYTAIGPLRMDLAFPLDRRGETDDPYQVYVSLGQSF